MGRSLDIFDLPIVPPFLSQGRLNPNSSVPIELRSLLDIYDFDTNT
jgi:hypothetical protein